MALGSVAGDGFGAALTAALQQLVAADSVLILAYRRDRRPLVLHDKFAHPLRQNNIGTYLDGAYLLDPFFSRAWRDDKPQLLRMAEIAPAGFEHSDYFLDYYKRSRVNDEVNFLAPAGADVSLALCYERAGDKPPFSGEEMRLLAAAQPLVCALLVQHWRAVAHLHKQEGRDERHDVLARRLDGLGAEVLTAREREVVQLVLRGYSNLAIAGLLDLSAETVKVHRRNIYRKLDISSLPELFSFAMRLLLQPDERAQAG